MKEKVMVFEVKKNTFIALSESGEFIEKPLEKQLEVGDYTYINNTQEQKVKEFRKTKSINYYPLLKVAAVFILAISLVLFMQDNISVIATIDINPSFEFHLDQNDEIVKAVPRSLEAEKIDQVIDFKGKTYKEGLTLLLEESINQGYIRQDKQNLVVVSMFDKDGKDIDTQKKEISNDIIKAISEEKKLDLVVATYDVEKEDYDEAERLKTSVNKVVATQKARELGLEINSEDINNKSIVDFAKDQGVAPGQLISEKAKIDQVEAAPPGLTKKDILPPGQSNKKGNAEQEQNEEDLENDNKKQGDSDLPPGLNKDKLDDKTPPGLNKDDSEDNSPPGLNKEKPTEDFSEDNKDNGNKPETPPGFDKKEEVDEDLADGSNGKKDEDENPSNKEPPGLKDKENNPPGLEADNTGQSNQENNKNPKDNAEDLEEDDDEKGNSQAEDDKGVNNPSDNNPGENNNSPGDNYPIDEKTSEKKNNHSQDSTDKKSKPENPSGKSNILFVLVVLASDG